MQMSDDYASAYAEQQMSGAPASAGMAPYPLYGLPTLGQETETAVPFYKRPMFCYGVGTAAGFGLGYLVFGMIMPRMSKKPKKNNNETDQ
jgi:hypothetical protein